MANWSIFEEEMVERSLTYQEEFLEIAMLTRKTVHQVRQRLGASAELYDIIVQNNSDTLDNLGRQYVEYLRARRFVRRLGVALHLVAAAHGETPPGETPHGSGHLERVFRESQFASFCTMAGIAVMTSVAVLICKREEAAKTELLRITSLEGHRKLKAAKTSLESPLTVKQIKEGLGGFVSDGLKSTLNYFVLLAMSALSMKLTGKVPPGFPKL